MEAKGRRGIRPIAAAEDSNEIANPPAPSPPVPPEPPAAPPSLTPDPPAIVAALPAPEATPARPETTVDPFAAFAESQAALARGFESMSNAAAGLAQGGIDSVARSATELLGVKTLAEVIEINAGFACRSVEALFAGSFRLSELGVQLASDTAAPLMTHFDREWRKAAGLYR